MVTVLPRTYPPAPSGLGLRTISAARLGFTVTSSWTTATGTAAGVVAVGAVVARAGLVVVGDAADWTGGVGDARVASSVCTQPPQPITVKNKQENSRLRTAVLYFVCNSSSGTEKRWLNKWSEYISRVSVGWGAADVAALR